MGRGGELAALDSFLAAARGGFALLAIEGEPGIGKTTLWHHGVRRAAEQGATVLTARATEAEGGLSLAGIGDLFDSLGEEAFEQLPDPQRQALSTALLRSSPPAEGIDERALAAAVLSVLRNLSVQRPVVLAVDDAQWLDSASARALGFAARRLDLERVGLLVTVRSVEGSPLPSFDRAAVEPARRQALRLGPLSVAALHEMIKNQTGRALPRPVIVRVAGVSGGNPFYTLEIATELHRNPPKGGQLPIPASLGQLLKERVDRLPGATQDALLGCAMLSRPSVELVDVETLEPAERAGIVVIEQGRIMFSHPLLASAVYDRVNPTERRRVHRHLADLVDDLEERARHLALGSVRADEAIAAELDAAAALAACRGAPAGAAELAELALELTPDGEDHRRLARLIVAGRFWFDAGDLGRSEETLRTALSGASEPITRAEALRLLGQVYARRSTFGQAMTVALEALGSAGADDALRGSIELDLTYYLVSLGDFPAAERYARSAVQTMDGTGRSGALADALAVLTMCEFLCGRGFDQDRMAKALELEEPTRTRTWQTRPSFLAGLLWLWTGHLGKALGALGGLHTQTLARGEESHVPFLCFYLLWAQLWHGELTAAASTAATAQEAAALLGDPASRGIALASGALLHAHDGSTQLACDEAREAIGCFEGLEWPAGTIWPLWALGLAQLAAGHPAEVDTALGPLAQMLPSMGAGDPVLGVFIPDEIEALIEIGDLDRAEALLEWFEGRAAELDRPWALATAGRCRSLMLSARGDHEGAVEVLERAISYHDRVEMPLERARTVLVLGRILRRMGSRAAAKEILTEAEDVFAQLGARMWRTRAEEELSRLGARRKSADKLSPTETLIANLAASGLSNQEIAERAHLTSKTVEANLTRVYRKLGIRSRGGLARALDTTAPYGSQLVPTENEQGNVVAVLARVGHRRHDLDALALRIAGRNRLAQPRQALVDRLAAPLDQPVGVQAEHGAGRPAHGGRIAV